jgi:hypothetical protein
MFFIDFSTNEVKRNLQFVYMFSSQSSSYHAYLINPQHLRMSLSFYVARKLIASNSKQWHTHADMYLIPMEKAK